MKKWQSKVAFKARVREWAKKLDVEVRIISIRTMKNKWASFTEANQLLIFNVDLLNIDINIGDYVIVHELLHFSVPNHGRLWKSLMRAHLGNYELLEAKLKKGEKGCLTLSPKTRLPKKTGNGPYRKIRQMSGPLLKKRRRSNVKD